MLRCHYLPSDFHPLLLIVGERGDMTRLAEVLSDFAEKGTPVAINALPGVSYSSCPMMLKQGEQSDRAGMIQLLDGLQWNIDSPMALAYASEMMDMLTQGQHSGSCFLEIGYIDEIRVKVSFGEFDDDWLLEKK